VKFGRSYFIQENQLGFRSLLGIILFAKHHVIGALRSLGRFLRQTVVQVFAVFRGFIVADPVLGKDFILHCNFFQYLFSKCFIYFYLVLNNKSIYLSLDMTVIFETTVISLNWKLMIIFRNVNWARYFPDSIRAHGTIWEWKYGLSCVACESYRIAIVKWHEGVHKDIYNFNSWLCDLLRFRVQNCISSISPGVTKSAIVINDYFRLLWI
jgi:hypothetical protein